MNNDLSRTRSNLLRLYAAGIGAVGAEQVVTRALVTHPSLETRRALDGAASIRMLAVGKAAPGMAAAAARIVGTRLRDGLVIAPHGVPTAPLPPGVRSLWASHPLPDAASEAAGRTALEFVAQTPSHELLLFLLSGGASALMAVPAAGISLTDKVAVSAALMRTEAPIAELNAVRKHLSELKGGGLLRRLPTGARMLSLILSDVIDNDLAVIGSGPAVADPTTFADAVTILKRRKVWGRAPEAVRARLERGMAGELPETLKEGDPRLASVTNVIVGDVAAALQAIAAVAEQLGYAVTIGPRLRGEAEKLGGELGRRLLAVDHPPACLIAGGEPVVTVSGNGKGGRAQHCALAIAVELAGAQRQVMALVAGSDGIDGPTDAAGAIVTPASVARAREAGIDPHAALRRCDSYNVFAALGDLLVIGPTGTNVGDLFIGLVNR
ncbi:MAG TPA: DUF4147 domain-containing protein [Candidatus Binataceae bacterium]|nr:DUF4147 domain-containing protein [Candidatus Binataceae bacterium]